MTSVRTTSDTPPFIWELRLGEKRARVTPYRPTIILSDFMPVELGERLRAYLESGMPQGWWVHADGFSRTVGHYEVCDCTVCEATRFVSSPAFCDTIASMLMVDRLKVVDAFACRVESTLFDNKSVSLIWCISNRPIPEVTLSEIVVSPHAGSALLTHEEYDISVDDNPWLGMIARYEP